MTLQNDDILMNNIRILAVAILLSALALSLPKPSYIQPQPDVTKPSLSIEPIVGPVDTSSDTQTSSNTAAPQSAGNVGAASIDGSVSPPSSGSGTSVRNKVGPVTNVISNGGSYVKHTQSGPDNSRGDTNGASNVDNSSDTNSDSIGTISDVASPLTTTPLLGLIP